MKVLVIEDEKRMADAIAASLKGERYDVEVAYDGTSGLDEILTGCFDMIVSDVMMPGLNGYEVARRTRAAGIKAPILLLTAKSDLTDKITGLDSGADDYLTKPFMTEELLARLRALARRSTPVDNGLLSVLGLTLDSHSFMLSCPASSLQVRLSDKEYRIMECLMMSTGRLTSREQLALKVWGSESDAEYNNVEVYISFTRKKLTFLKAPVEIKAVRGLGYELKEAR